MVKYNMFRRILLTCSLLLLTVIQVMANVQVTVTSKSNPMPAQGLLYYSDPGSYFTIMVTNTQQESVPIRIELSLHGPMMTQANQWEEISDSYLEVYSDEAISLPYTMGMGSHIMTPSELQTMFRQYRFDQVHINGAIYDAFTSASNGSFGLLPEGHYGLKVTVKTNYPGEGAGAVLGTGYCFFDICYIASAPQFIQPVASSIADDLDFSLYGYQYANFPSFPHRFAWTRPTMNLVSVSNARQFTYDFRIRRIATNQSPTDAALYGAVAYQQLNLVNNYCDIPALVVSDLKQSGTQNYVVQVVAKAVQNDIQTATYTMVENQGKSEILVVGFPSSDNGGGTGGNDDDDDNEDNNGGGHNGGGNGGHDGGGDNGGGNSTNEEEGLIPDDEGGDDNGNGNELPLQVRLTAKSLVLPSKVMEYWDENIDQYLNVEVENTSETEYGNVCMLLQIYNKEVGHGVVARPVEQKSHTTNNTVNISESSNPGGMTLTAPQLRLGLGGYRLNQLVDFVPTTGRVLDYAPADLSTLGITHGTICVRIVEITDPSKPISSQKTIGKGYLDVDFSESWDQDICLTIEPIKNPATNIINTYLQHPGSIYKVTATNNTAEIQRIFLTMTQSDDDEDIPYRYHMSFRKDLANFLLIEPNTKKEFTPAEVDAYLGATDLTDMEWLDPDDNTWKKVIADEGITHFGNGNQVTAKVEAYKFDAEREPDLAKDETISEASCDVIMSRLDAKVKIELNRKESALFSTDPSVGYFNTPSSLFTAKLTNLTKEEQKFRLRLYYSVNTESVEYDEANGLKYTAQPEDLDTTPESTIITLAPEQTINLDNVEYSLDTYVGGYTMDDVYSMTTGEKTPDLKFATALFEGITGKAVLSAFTLDETPDVIGEGGTLFKSQETHGKYTIECAPLCKFAIDYTTNSFGKDILRYPSKNFSLAITNNTAEEKEIKVILDYNDGNYVVPSTSFELHSGERYDFLSTVTVLKDWEDPEIKAFYEKYYKNWGEDRVPKMNLLGCGQEYINGKQVDDALDYDSFLKDGLNTLRVWIFEPDEDGEYHLKLDPAQNPFEVNFYYYSESPFNIELSPKDDAKITPHVLNYWRRPSDYFDIAITNKTDHLCERLAFQVIYEGKDYVEFSSIGCDDENHPRFYLENLEPGAMTFLSDEDVDKLLSFRYGFEYPTADNDGELQKEELRPYALGPDGTLLTLTLRPVVRDAEYPNIVYNFDYYNAEKNPLKWKHSPLEFAETKDAELYVLMPQYPTQFHFTMEKPEHETEVFVNRKYSPMPINSDAYVKAPEKIYENVVLDNYAQEEIDGYLYMNYYPGSKATHDAHVEDKTAISYYTLPKQSLRLGVNRSCYVSGTGDGVVPLTNYMGGYELSETRSDIDGKVTAMPAALKDGLNYMYTEFVDAKAKDPENGYTTYARRDEEFTASSDFMLGDGGETQTLNLDVTLKDAADGSMEWSDYLKEPSKYFDITVHNLLDGERNVMMLALYDSAYVDVTGINDMVNRGYLHLKPSSEEPDGHHLTDEEVDLLLQSQREDLTTEDLYRLTKEGDVIIDMKRDKDLATAKLERGKHSISFRLYRRDASADTFLFSDEDGGNAQDGLSYLQKYCAIDTLFFSTGILANYKDCFYDYTKEITDKNCGTWSKEQLKDMTIHVGGYDLKITEAEQSKDGTLKGKGVLAWIPNEVPVHINCEFANLKVNASKQCFDGAVTSTQSCTDAPYEWFKESTLKDAQRSEYIKKMKEEVEGNSTKFLNYYKYVQGGMIQQITDQKGYGDDRVYDLPAKVPNTLLDEEHSSSLWPVDVQLVSIYVSPQKSYMNLVGEFVMPEVNADKGQNIVMFGAPQLCMSNSGWLPEDGKLAMMTDYVVNANGYEFRLVAPTDWENKSDGCYFAWENGKFGEVTLSASLTMPDLLAVDENYKLVKDEDANEDGDIYKKAAGKFTVSFRDKENWIIKLGLENFQVKSAKGYTFMPTGETEGVVFDFSSKVTPAGIAFPEGYDFKAAGDYANRDEWKGCYIEQCAVRFPSFFKLDKQKVADGDTEESAKADASLEVGVKDVIIDKTFTSQIYAESAGYNLKAGGWKLSLDTLSFKIKQSSFDEFFFCGKFNVPVFTGDIGYRASVNSLDAGGYKYEFKTQQNDSLKLDAFLAEVDLDKEQTYFDLSYTDYDEEAGKEDEFKVELCAGGTIYIAGTKDKVKDLPCNLKIGGMKFVGMRVANFPSSEDKKYADQIAAQQAAQGSDGFKEVSKTGSEEAETSEISGKQSDGSDFYYSLGRWKLASPRKTLGPFGFTLTDFNLAFKNEDKLKVGLKIGGSIDICSAFSAGARVGIWGKLDDDDDLKYDKTELEKISVGADFAVIKIAGSLEASNDDSMGSGFAASLNLKMPGNLFSIDMEGGYYEKKKTAEEFQIDSDMGKEHPDSTYSWGYLEATVGLGQAGNIPPVSLKDIGGGFYFNCSLDKKASYYNYGGKFNMTMSILSDINAGVDATIIYDAYNKRLSNFTFKGKMDALGGVINAGVTLVYANPSDTVKYLDLLVTADAEVSDAVATKLIAETTGVDIDALASKFTKELGGFQKCYENFTGNSLLSDIQEADANQPGLQESVGANGDEVDSSTEGDAQSQANEAKGKGKLDNTAPGVSMGAHISLNLHVNFLNKKWHVYIGEPDLEKRCTVTYIDFHVGSKDDPVAAWCKEYANAYLCFGNELPNNGVLPEIPTELQEFLYGGDKSKNANGEIVNNRDKIREKREAEANALLGCEGGIMMGICAGGEIGVNAVIAYAEVSALAGFDFCLKKLANGARCSNSGARAGRNGWYATGQAYAMLQGEMGAMINLWIFKGKVPFIDFGIGALLKGGGPNPSWFYGKAKAKVKLLGGLIHFNNSITFKAGDVCLPDYGNPLDNIKIFGDITPEYTTEEAGWECKEEQYVSPYTVPQFATNMCMDTEIRLVDENQANAEAGMEGDASEYYKNAERTYRFTFVRDSLWLDESVEDKEMETTTTTRYTVTLTGNADNTGFSVNHGRLQPQSRYKLTLTAKAQEKVTLSGSTASWVDPVFKDEKSNYKETNRYWGQQAVVYFRTGNLPDELDDNDIAIARPGKKHTAFKDSVIYQDEAHHPYLSLTSGDRYDDEKNGLLKEGSHICGVLQSYERKTAVSAAVLARLNAVQRRALNKANPFVWKTLDSCNVIQHCYQKDIYIWEPERNLYIGKTFTPGTKYRYTIERVNDAALEQYELDLKNRQEEQARFNAEDMAQQQSVSLNASADDYPSDGTFDLQQAMTDLYNEEASSMYEGISSDTLNVNYLANKNALTDAVKVLYQSEFTVSQYDNYAAEVSAQAQSGTSSGKIDPDKHGFATFLKATQNYTTTGYSNVNTLESRDFSDEEVYHGNLWKANPYFYMAYWLNFGFVSGKKISSKHPYFDEDFNSTEVKLTLENAGFRTSGVYTGNLQDQFNLRGSFTAVDMRDEVMPSMYYRMNQDRMNRYSGGTDFKSSYDSINTMLIHDARLAEVLLPGAYLMAKNFDDTFKAEWDLYNNATTDQARERRLGYLRDEAKSLMQSVTSGTGKAELSSISDYGHLTYLGLQNVMLWALTTRYNILTEGNVAELGYGYGRAANGLSDTGSPRNYSDDPLDRILTDAGFKSSDYLSTVKSLDFQLYRPNGYHCNNSNIEAQVGYTVYTSGSGAGTLQSNAYNVTMNPSFSDYTVAGTVSASSAGSLPAEETTTGNETKYIGEVAVAVADDKSDWETAQQMLVAQGYIVLGTDLNALVSGAASGKYVSMGYKPTTNAQHAVKDIRLYYSDKKKDSGDLNFSLNDKWYTQASFYGNLSRNGDCNAGAGGKYVYVLVSYDGAEGEALTHLSIRNNGSTKLSATSGYAGFFYPGASKTSEQKGSCGDLNWSLSDSYAHLYLQTSTDVHEIAPGTGSKLTFFGDLMTVTSKTQSTAVSILQHEGYTLLSSNPLNNVTAGSAQKVYLGYKKTSQGDHYHAITGLYIIESVNALGEDSRVIEGREYHKCKHYGAGNGNLMEGTGVTNKYRYLYYTTDGNENSGEALTYLGLSHITTAHASQGKNFVKKVYNGTIASYGCCNEGNDGSYHNYLTTVYSEYYGEGAQEASPVTITTRKAYVNAVCVSANADDATAIWNLMKDGYTILNQNLNQGASTAVPVYMGYKVTSSLTKASVQSDVIKDIIYYNPKTAKPLNKLVMNGRTYYCAEETSSTYQNDVNAGQKWADRHFYVYYTTECDKSGNVVTDLSVENLGSGSSSDAGNLRTYRATTLSLDANICPNKEADGDHIYIKQQTATDKRAVAPVTYISNVIVIPGKTAEYVESYKTTVAKAYGNFKTIETDLHTDAKYFMFLGYTTTTNPDSAITDLLIYKSPVELDGNGHSFLYNGKTYKKAVCLGETEDGNLNSWISSGGHLYLFYALARDQKGISTANCITSLDVTDDSGLSVKSWTGDVNTQPETQKIGSKMYINYTSEAQTITKRNYGIQSCITDMAVSVNYSEEAAKKELANNGYTASTCIIRQDGHFAVVGYKKSGVSTDAVTDVIILKSYGTFATQPKTLTIGGKTYQLATNYRNNVYGSLTDIGLYYVYFTQDGAKQYETGICDIGVVGRTDNDDHVDSSYANQYDRQKSSTSLSGKLTVDNKAEYIKLTRSRIK